MEVANTEHKFEDVACSTSCVICTLRGDVTLQWVYRPSQECDRYYLFYISLTMTKNNQRLIRLLSS